jgi:hypothetical protein
MKGLSWIWFSKLPFIILNTIIFSPSLLIVIISKFWWCFVWGSILQEFEVRPFSLKADFYWVHNQHTGELWLARMTNKLPTKQATRDRRPGGQSFVKTLMGQHSVIFCSLLALLEFLRVLLIQLFAPWKRQRRKRLLSGPYTVGFQYVYTMVYTKSSGSTLT